mmetsp:Transcript_23197/g.65831  ORF Transcript_23197/g.65831 Transcript_23197/m.65831 type:complete len:262 (-) Transcript_23197:219-1004(-)
MGTCQTMPDPSCQPPWPFPLCRRATVLLTLMAVAPRVTAQDDETAVSTSTSCRADLDGMVTDPNWRLVYNTSSRWCRVRLENQMARCCSISNFPQGTAEGCDENLCKADCRHTHMNALCSRFGRACTVRRNPFTPSGPFEDVRPSSISSVEVLETFCVPELCDNGPDREALMQWYDVRYRTDRSHWQANYDMAILECDSGIVTIILITIGTIASLLLCGACLIFICVAPKEKGRTLVSQAEMNADNDQVEPMDGKSTRTPY